MMWGMRGIWLRCEHREDVPCVDGPAPRLAWALEAEGHDRRQTAYRITVRDLWDSGWVDSARTEAEYAGPPLPPGAELEWRVRVRDEAGEQGPWSEPARFRTALAAWSADWIARDRVADPPMPVPGTDRDLDEADPMMIKLDPCPFLRRRFALGAPVRRATLYATARGLVELRLNGTRVGDHVLAPGWTDYRERIEYAAHDVTPLLDAGENVLGAVLGDGWYAGFVGFDARRPGNHYGREPQLLCELHVEHEDGGRTVIGTDGAWRAATGPLVYADFLMGERVDARRDLGPWAEPGYDDSAWGPVEVTPRDGVRLVPERAQPIRVTQELPAVSVTERAPGVHVVDLGQNLVGWVRLELSGERGTRVQLRHAEMLQPDGTPYMENMRAARPLDTFVLAGEGTEVFEPRFTFHGFRYVEVTGLDALAPEQVTGCVVHSDTPAAGEFECSDELVNQLWRNVRWGQRGNFLSVPTDCPQRDERLGWLADAQVFLPTAMLNMDVAAFVTKWGDDLLDAQLPGGAYPDVAPRLLLEREGAPAWADAGVIVPWLMWRRYGDLRFVQRHWEAMERYMAHLQRHNPDGLWTARRGNDYGDWLSVGAHTPRDVVATAYWAQDARMMAAMARALGLGERAAHYERLFDGIRAAFGRAFVGEDAYVEGDTQTAYLLALHMDLLDEPLRARAAERLVADIERHGGHLTTGFIGVGILCPVLTRFGHADVAHRLLRADTFPSWGYSIRQGATTIWERWDGWTEDGGFQTPMMNSFNHYSLGSVVQWAYESVAGIRSVAPAYERLLIAPEPGELEWARASFRSPRGRIATSWWREDESFRLEVELPPNVTATVVMPDGATKAIGSGHHVLTTRVA
jgi:alpha-L-rhamnosidase